MGVYTRFKRGPEGFRAIVELLESTPASRRTRMIEVGMQEDPEFTERALKYVFNFQDVLDLPDLELAEVVAASPPKILGFALHGANPSVKERFLRCAKPRIFAELKDALEVSSLGSREIGGAQLKIITVVRSLEKKGLVRSKRIP